MIASAKACGVPTAESDVVFVDLKKAERDYSPSTATRPSAWVRVAGRKETGGPLSRKCRVPTKAARYWSTSEITYPTMMSTRIKAPAAQAGLSRCRSSKTLAFRRFSFIA